MQATDRSPATYFDSSRGARSAFSALGVADLVDSREACVSAAESLRAFVRAVRARDYSFQPMSSAACERCLSELAGVLSAHAAVLRAVSGVDYSGKYLPVASGLAQELRLGMSRILSAEVGFKTFGLSAEESIDSLIFRLNEDRLAIEPAPALENSASMSPGM